MSYRRSPYGKKGGASATAGRKAFRYEVALPDGSTKIKRHFIDCGDTAIATGFSGADGKAPCLVVWQGAPAWEGDMGRMTARKLPLET